jgi:hypothetical protein
VKRFLVALGAGVLMFGPATAADVETETSNYALIADLWGGYHFLGQSDGDADDDGLDEGFFAFGGGASMLFGLGSDLTFQLSAEAASSVFSTEDADDDQVASAGQVAAHLIHGVGLGLFGGGGVVAYQDDDSNNYYFIGGEYQHDFSSFDVLLQGGYVGASVTDDTIRYTFENAWFGRIAPSFDFGNGFELGAYVAYVSGQLDANDQDAHIWDAGASFGYQLQELPVSLYLGYQGLFFDTDGTTFDEHLVKAGIRMSLGGIADSEIDTPEVYRWVGAGQRMD